MSRIPLVDVASMTAEQQQQYDRFPSNLSRALLLTQSRLARCVPELANALRASGLDAKLREAVILRVAALNASAYERMQHAPQATLAGWTDTDIAAIEEGKLSALPDDAAILLRFADELVAGPRVSDGAFHAARGLLSDHDLVTVILLVGHYMMVARLLATLDVDLDDEPDSFASEH